jgi:peptide/nickel transport system substrate-binding protein
VTLEMPYEEYDRLKGGSGIVGTDAPISDIGMIFLNDIDAMLDPNVRMAAAMSIDKQLIIDRLLSGYGVAIDTLQTPEYDRLSMPRSRFPTIPRRLRNCWRLPATRRTTR